MPREACALSPSEVVIRDYDLPDLCEGLVRVTSEFAAAKHGTESAYIKGYAQDRGTFDYELRVWPGAPPGEQRSGGGIGNMVVGTVCETAPDVDGLSVGDRVLAYASFREVHTVRAADCWKMPGDLSWKSAVCLDPANFAMGAVRDGNVRIGDAVAAFGMGAIGLMTVRIAKLSGAHPIIAVEPLPNRRKVAELCGADVVLDPAGRDVGLELKLMTGKRGVDVAIDFSGSPHALQAALRGVALGGTVVAGAFPPPYGPGLDLGAEAHMNRPNIVFSRACTEPNRDHPRWDEARIYAECWRLIQEGSLPGADIVEPVVKFEQLVTAYPRIISDPGSSVKLGVEFQAPR